MATKKKTYIRRAEHGKENPYFLLLRGTAQDRALSYEARGMLAYILSKPDTWRVQPNDLITDKCGRDKVYRILKELKEARYIEREKSFDKKHRVVWGDYVVHEQPYADIPYTESQEMEQGENPLPEIPDTEVPDTEKPDSRDYRLLDSTESETTEQKDIAPDGAAGAAQPTFKTIELDAPIFNQDRVFDCLAWALWHIKDMRDLKKPLMVKGKEKENPAGAMVGKVRAWLLPLYPERDEPFIAAKVRAFYKDWPNRRKYAIPRDLAKFITEWLAWDQAGMPAPRLDKAATEYTDDLLPGVELE